MSIYTITSLVQAKYNPDHVNVFLDNEFWISLHKNMLLEAGLSKGTVITQEQKEELEETSKDSSLIERSMKYVTIRPRSVYEVRNYLKYKRNLDDAQSEKIIDILKEKGYLSDEVFAKWFVDNRSSIGFHGKNKIRAELINKGVPREIIESALDSLNSEEYKLYEVEQIKEYITKMQKTGGELNKHKLKQRILSRLQSRGFSLEDILAVFRELGL